jgi:hypothetical protein
MEDRKEKAEREATASTSEPANGFSSHFNQTLMDLAEWLKQ